MVDILGCKHSWKSYRNIHPCFICRGLSKETQMLLFSATYDQTVMKFATAVVPNPFTIRLRREEESLDNIKQVFVHA